MIQDHVPEIHRTILEGGIYPARSFSSAVRVEPRG